MSLPAPYYSEDGITIYCGDCREIMPELEANVTVTDPPYGMGHYATDLAAFTPDMLANWKMPLAIFGYPERLVGLCVAAARVPDEWVTWWPTNAAIKAFNLSGLLKEAECVAIFGPSRFEQLRQARTVSSRRVLDRVQGWERSSARLEFQGEPSTRRMGDVWTDAAPGLAFQAHLRQHPNEKPLGVMLRLVEGMAALDATVLDPFMGSGTTLVAAKQLGRKAIGIEIEERYCEVAVQRLAQGVLPLETP